MTMNEGRESEARELREQIARKLFTTADDHASWDSDEERRRYWLIMADEVLTIPALQRDALIDALKWAMGHVDKPTRRIPRQNEVYCDGYEKAMSALTAARSASKQPVQPVDHVGAGALIVAEIERLDRARIGKHELFETGDPGAPDCIKDRNGEVVLDLCEVRGRAEIELDQPCEPKLKDLLEALAPFAAACDKAEADSEQPIAEDCPVFWVASDKGASCVVFGDFRRARSARDAAIGREE